MSRPHKLRKEDIRWLATEEGCNVAISVFHLRVRVGQCWQLTLSDICSVPIVGKTCAVFYFETRKFSKNRESQFFFNFLVKINIQIALERKDKVWSSFNDNFTMIPNTSFCSVFSRGNHSHTQMLLSCGSRKPLQLSGKVADQSPLRFAGALERSYWKARRNMAQEHIRKSLPRRPASQ